MKNCEFEKFETFDKVFTFCVRGIEDHLYHDVPDTDMVIDSLNYMVDTLHDLIESFRNPENEKLGTSFADKYYSDIAMAYNCGFKEAKGENPEGLNAMISDICDSCDKALNAETQAALDKHCENCSLLKAAERRC